jgi:hypothetical protein
MLRARICATDGEHDLPLDVPGRSSLVRGGSLR